MRYFLLAAGLACLAACSPSGTTPASDAPGTDETAAGATAGGYAPIKFEGETATPDERERCEAAGGEVEPAGRAGFEHCIQTFADAGQTCSDTDECTGTCLVPGQPVEAGTLVTGQCAENDNPFGCYQTVTGGKADEAICVD